MTTRTGHKLSVICGLPGSGKTHYGRMLAASSGAVLLDIDTVTEPVVRAGLALAGMNEDDRDSETFKKTFRDPIYESLFATARENLLHNDVIVCGPFTREVQQPDWSETLSVNMGTEVEIIYLYCPPALRKTRIQARANPRDLAKLKAWQAHALPPSAPRCSHRYIDTSQHERIGISL